jgi:hypothetical protein
MKVVLELQDQPSNVRRITVRHDIVIGRGSDCNLRLSAPQVSRRHGFLRVGRDSVSVTDLDSSNGTYIDGTRITAGKRYDIADGAQLALGPIRFIIHVRSDVAVAETAKSGSAPESNRFKAGRDTEATYAAEDGSIINARIQPGDANPPMDYAVEQGGESAEPHEPTAEYLDEQFSTNGSANLFSNAPDPADSRLGIADFGKRPAEQPESNEETNDFPDADIVGKSAGAHDEPQWDSNVVDSSNSPDDVEASNLADDVESAWLSVDDDDSLLPQPMNLGNAHVGEFLNDSFNDVDAGVIDDVVEIEEVMEVHEFNDVAKVNDFIEVAEIPEMAADVPPQIGEVKDDIRDVAVIEDGSADAEVLEVEDWLTFDDVVEVQDTPNLEVVEDEDVLELADEVLEEDGESNWLTDNEASESDAFFENVISPELEAEDTNSAEAAEEDDEIDPDLQNFFKGF